MNKYKGRKHSYGIGEVRTTGFEGIQRQSHVARVIVRNPADVSASVESSQNRVRIHYKQWLAYFIMEEGYAHICLD